MGATVLVARVCPRARYLVKSEKFNIYPDFICLNDKSTTTYVSYCYHILYTYVHTDVAGLAWDSTHVMLLYVV